MDGTACDNGGRVIARVGPPPMRRNLLLFTLLAAAIGLGLMAEYFALGSAAAVEALFYLALLGFVIGVLRLLVPPR